MAAWVDPDLRGALSWFDLGRCVHSLDVDMQFDVVQSPGSELGIDAELIRGFVSGGPVEGFTLADVIEGPFASIGSFTPLYVATVRGDADMAEALIASGANPDTGGI